MTTPEDRKLLMGDRWWEKLPRAVYATLERVPCSQPWFEVYKVLEGIYAIYEPGQYEEALCTLLLGQGEAVLIDTGCGIANVKACVEEITDLPITVVNTHAHNDHIADNHRFERIAMLDHPWSVRAQSGLPNSVMIHLVDSGMVWKPLPEGFDPKKYVVPPFKVTRWFRDGDVIDLGSRTLEVLETPGHSPDSCCFLDREDRLLFTGDMFYTGGIYTYLNGGDIPTFIESYEYMLSHYDEYDMLMPSHNEPWVEKKLLKDVYKAVVDISEGRGRYREGTDMGVPIKRFDYGRFNIVTRADQHKPR